MEKTASGKRKHVATRISKIEIKWLNHVLSGDSAREAGRKCGFNARKAKYTSEWIQSDRERSTRPYLWDMWRAALDRQIRLLDVNPHNIIRELAIIGFSSIDKFIDFPTKADYKREQAKDARTREAMGIASKADEDAIIDDENDSESWKKYRPGSVIKLKCYEDIPADLMPAIAEIHETKEGIRIKLHNKLDALDKLCRIQKMFTSDIASDDDDDKEINIIVNGSKSKLLPPSNSVTINIDP